MHPQSYEQIKKVAATIKKNDWVLDVGSYDVNGCYRPLFPTQKYTGVDIAAGPNVDVVQTDPFVLPFEDNSFDVVISGNMLEHCTMPWKMVLEMDRVLKSGGTLAITVPWALGYHAYPIDCYRFSPDAFKVLFGSWMVENGRKEYKVIENCFGSMDTFFTGIKQ